MKKKFMVKSDILPQNLVYGKKKFVAKSDICYSDSFFHLSLIMDLCKAPSTTSCNSPNSPTSKEKMLFSLSFHLQLDDGPFLTLFAFTLVGVFFLVRECVTCLLIVASGLLESGLIDFKLHSPLTIVLPFLLKFGPTFELFVSTLRV